MCRSIKTLFNFEPPTTELEIRDASLRFVRKLRAACVCRHRRMSWLSMRRWRPRPGSEPPPQLIGVPLQLHEHLVAA